MSVKIDKPLLLSQFHLQLTIRRAARVSLERALSVVQRLLHYGVDFGCERDDNLEVSLLEERRKQFDVVSCGEISI